MIKTITAALVFFCTLPGLLSAGAFQTLNSYGQPEPVRMPVPEPAALTAQAQDYGTPAGDDPVLNALSEAQWDAILNAPEYDALAGAIGQNKELYSDFHTRYLVKGAIDFRSTPPVFTATNGKVFKVLRYPAWLREAGAARICVEAFARQRDNTAEMIIDKVLPPNALEGLEPSAQMQALQRDPFMVSRAVNYVLGNVNWSLQHNAAGARVADSYGNFVSEWETGVTVKPEYLERAFFVKKNTLGKVKYGDHGLLVFTFRPGGFVTADGRQARAMAVSLDAFYKDPANMVYSPVEALKGKYMVYYSVQNLERYAEFRMHDGGESMQLYPLKLTLGQRVRLLDNALAKATDNNRGEMYSLFYNSCANSALSLINSVLTEDQKIKDGWLPEIVYRVQTTFPDSITALLLKKGIAEKPLPELTIGNYLAFTR